jgi:hypothetical protein
MTIGAIQCRESNGRSCLTWAAAPGQYKVAPQIIDPRTTRPAIGFANKLLAHEGWTVLSTVNVSASPD